MHFNKLLAMRLQIQGLYYKIYYPILITRVKSQLGSISTVLAVGRKRLFAKGVVAPGYIPEGTRKTCLQMTLESPGPVKGVEEILI